MDREQELKYLKLLKENIELKAMLLQANMRDVLQQMEKLNEPEVTEE